MSFGTGIKLAAGFDLNSGVPLDSRTVVANLTELNAITAIQKYVGLKVYVVSDSATYVWDGDSWDPCENKILSLSAAPLTEDGIIGDWAIDTSTSNMYHKELVESTATWVLKMNLKGTQGVTGNTGAPFSIAKVFTSITQMAEYTGEDLTDGAFILISTGNVEDEDNAKLYVKDSNVTTGDTIGYSYLTDLSGSQGIQGTAATVNVGTVTSSVAGSTPTVVNSGTTSEAVFDFTIPAGAKGDRGNSVAVVDSLPGTFTVIGDIYILSTSWDVYKTVLGENETITTSLVGNIKGATGTAGSNGVDGAKIYSVTTAPTAETGVDGDWAIDIITSDVYVKADGTWSSSLNIKGATGADGNNGVDGNAATITVGTVTVNPTSTTEATVVNSGTANAAVLDFNLPRTAKIHQVSDNTTVITSPSTSDWAINTTTGDVLSVAADGSLSVLFNIKGADGIQGTTGANGVDGKPFTVSKVFASVAEMNAYAGEDVTEGDFVIVNTGNVEDEDNAKLYVKGASSYTFITDLSGSQGIKGDPGTTATIEVGTVTTVNPDVQASVTNTGTTNAAVLNFNIPKGATGVRGSITLNVTAIPDNTTGVDGDWAIDTITYDLYNKISGVWTLSGNIKGAIGDTGDNGADGAKIYSVSTAPTAESGVDGDWAIDTSTYNLYNKVSGTWNITCNIKGAAGDTIKYGTDYATAATAKIFFKVVE